MDLQQIGQGNVQ